MRRHWYIPNTSDHLCLQSNEFICKACVSLNYTKYDELKPKEDVQTPFKLEWIPIHLLEMVIVKMDQQSFTRMRRTNKEYCDYIEKHRGQLRIALFHTMNLSFSYLPAKEEPLLQLERMDRFKKAHREKYFDHTMGRNYKYSSYTDFGMFTNAVEVSVTYSSERAVFNSRGTRIRAKNRPDLYDTFKGTSTYEVTEHPAKITIYLREWENNPMYQREFIGVYHNNYLKLATRNPEIPKNMLDVFASFFNWAGISKIDVYCRRFTDVASMIGQMKLNSVKMSYEETTDSKILQKKEFENLKHLYVYQSSFLVYPEDLKNIETFTIHDRKTSQSSVLPLLESWIAGKLILKEFCIGTEWNISLDSLDVQPVQKRKSWKYCRRFMTFDKWQSAKLLRVYLLKQKGTESQAVCIITDRFTRFRVISPFY